MALTAGKQLMPVKKASPKFYFSIPFDETVLYDELTSIFDKVEGDTMISLISVSVSTDQTVIWYDHHEDAFEDKINKPTQTSTEVWGDGDASNGCRPDVPQCTDEDDVLNAGDSFVIKSEIPLPRDTTDFLYDAGDVLAGSNTIAVTRSAYSKTPGIDLAGATEIYPQNTMWGDHFESPIGPEVDLNADSFGYVSIFVTSGYDNNNVTLPNGDIETVHEGECIKVRVGQGDEIRSQKSMQAHLVVADMNESEFEMRWFSLFPVRFLTNEYMSPVGTENASTLSLSD